MHILRGLLIAVVAFPRIPRRQRDAHVRRWSWALLDRLGVRLRVGGAVPSAFDGPLMLVANHVSWLDIVAINAVLPARFVAKSEVRAWPVIGWLARAAGTLFIERGRRRDAARINGELAGLMRDGEIVAVFPEGTTTDGRAVLPFRASLMQAALLAEARVLPVALRFTRADGLPCSEAAYCGETTFWTSLKRIAGETGLCAELTFLASLESRGRQRREIARETRDLILRSLFPRAPDSRSGRGAGPRAASR